MSNRYECTECHRINVARQNFKQDFSRIMAKNPDKVVKSSEDLDAAYMTATGKKISKNCSAEEWHNAYGEAFGMRYFQETEFLSHPEKLIFRKPKEFDCRPVTLKQLYEKIICYMF
jgi:hypothetical protein